MLNGEFYTRLQSWLRQRHYKHGFSERKEFKQKVLSFLFRKNLPEDARASIHLAMESVYPEFYKWVRYQKRTDYKALSHTAMKMESGLFIGRAFGEYKPFDKWAFPTHDELTVKEGDEVDAVRFLKRAIFDIFGIETTEQTFRIEKG